jgi:hypothetical protein
VADVMYTTLALKPPPHARTLELDAQVRALQAEQLTPQTADLGLHPGETEERGRIVDVALKIHPPISICECLYTLFKPRPFLYQLHT